MLISCGLTPFEAGTRRAQKAKQWCRKFALFPVNIGVEDGVYKCVWLQRYWVRYPDAYVSAVWNDYGQVYLSYAVYSTQKEKPNE